MVTHQISWYMRRRIVYARIADSSLSERSLKDLNDQLIPFIRHGDPPNVHLIIDASTVNKMKSTAPVPLSFLHEPQLGWNILIASDAVAKSLRRHLGGTHFRSFTSLEEGLFFLEDEDATLLAPV